jgi:hypothetical protein|nr:MAG TPA: hypothetical protein [Caudoviricetes sp.]
MSTQVMIRIPLSKNEYKSLLFYVNEDEYRTEYIVKRKEALKNFSNFLSRREQEYLERCEAVNDVVFYTGDD